MFKADIVNRMEACGAMAIVRTESIERGKEIARGCLQGGVDVMEISYTLPNAGDVIAALNHEFGKTMLVGAGTILDAETCRMAILAGAKFVIAYVQSLSDTIRTRLYDHYRDAGGVRGWCLLYQGLSDFQFLWAAACENHSNTDSGNAANGKWRCKS